MRQTTKVTAALFAFGLLSVLSPLAGEEKKIAAVATPPAEQRNAVLRELDMRLQKRQWAEAHALAGRLVEEWRGSVVQQIDLLLGRALMGLALAEAGLGREAEALWRWQEAQNLGGVGAINLSVYGPPGELLAAHRLRWWDEAPRGMTVLAAHELGPEGMPPRKLSGSDLVLTGPLANVSVPKWAWIQMVVDKDGRVAAGQMLEDHPWGPDLVRPDRLRPDPGPVLAGSSSVTKPRKIAGGPPIYTQAARDARVQGKAILEAIIDETGHIAQVRLLENLRYGLDLAAMDMVCGWRFAPAMYEGKPVKVYYSLTVNFGVQR